MLNFCCFHGQLAPFPVATCRPLTSVVGKHAKITGDNIVTIGNTVIFKSKTLLRLTQLIIMEAVM